jgi:hypothetical protein
MEAAEPELSVAAEAGGALPARAGAESMLHIFAASVHLASDPGLLAGCHAAS